MRLRLLTSRVTALGHAQRPGDEIEVDDADGRRMLAAGQAEPLKARRETQAMTGGEKAVMPEPAAKWR